MPYSVSIIVPVYCAEHYIEQCVRSLFEQDFDSIEYIFVDDCSPDNSIEILKTVAQQYPERSQHVHILTHHRNLGSSAARKTGLENATGEYVAQVDSDDWVESDMISSFFNKAKEEDSDIVICDIFKELPNEQVYEASNYVVGREFEMALSSELSGSLWNKLVRRTLYVDNDLVPLENISIGEDKLLSIKLMFFANKVSYLNRALYHYRLDNRASLTSTIGTAAVSDIELVISEVDSFLKQQAAYEKYVVSFKTLVVDQQHFLYRKTNGKQRLSAFKRHIDFEYVITRKANWKYRVIAAAYLLGMQNVLVLFQTLTDRIRPKN